MVLVVVDDIVRVWDSEMSMRVIEMVVRNEEQRIDCRHYCMGSSVLWCFVG